MQPQCNTTSLDHKPPFWLIRHMIESDSYYENSAQPIWLGASQALVICYGDGG